MKRILTIIIIIGLFPYFALSNKHWDAFLVAPKFLNVSHERNFEDKYSYSEINFAVGDYTSNGEGNTDYYYYRSHYFKTGLGLKYLDSGELTPYFNLRVADVEKVSAGKWGKNVLLMFGSEALCYGRSLNYKEEMNWVLLKAGLGYNIIDSYPMNFSPIIYGKLGYTAMKLDTISHYDFRNIDRSEKSTLDALAGFKLNAEYKPVSLVLDISSRALMSSPKIYISKADLKLSLRDYSTNEVLINNKKKFIDFADYDIFIIASYEKFSINDIEKNTLNFQIGINWYLNNRQTIKNKI